jgi:predicted DNA-binding transcriptional regulator AlpA
MAVVDQAAAQPMLPLDGLVPAKTVARYLGFSDRTLENWRATGFGPPYIRLRRHVRYDAAAVRAWKRAQDAER